MLASAIGEADIRNALAQTLVGKPGWSESFVNYVAGNGYVQATVLLFDRLRAGGMTVPAGSQALVVSRPSLRSWKPSDSPRTAASACLAGSLSASAALPHPDSTSKPRTTLDVTARTFIWSTD